MHVVHLIYQMEVGGAETMLVDVINEQVANGLEVSLIVVNSGVNRELVSRIRPEAQIVCMQRRQGSMPLLMMLRLNILLARMRPDIIHAHHYKFCRLVRWRRSRLLYTVHDMGVPMIYSAGVSMVAITDAVAEDVRQRLPGAKVTTITNGIRTADITRRTQRGAGTPFRIVQVARLLASKKGQDILIEALAMLSQRGVDNVEVDFIGNGPDLEELQGKARQLGVDGRVRFLGLRDREYNGGRASSGAHRRRRPLGSGRPWQAVRIIRQRRLRSLRRCSVESYFRLRQRPGTCRRSPEICRPLRHRRHGGQLQFFL